ncbi:MAG: GNAT family N-acetyltransferase [Clostridia bacterium]|nr:GNAT family N-acetyltransferase [Clostridia bacterium]
MNVLKTQRLTLRPFCDNDAEAMFKGWTYDERVARYCRWYPHKSIETTKQLLKMYLDEAAGGFTYRWAIEIAETQELCGCIDVVDISDDGKTASVGYVLSFDKWNRGYMTEALEAVIEKLFCEGFEAVSAVHYIDNIASGRVMEKCGMKYVGNDKTLYKYGSDELCDVKVYEIRKADN